MGVEPGLDFRHLKAAVSIERVLVARGLADRMRHQGRRLVGPCPIHGGHGQTSFVVDQERNVWFCFSVCATGGDVVDLVRRLDGVGYRQAAETLAALALLSPPSAPRASGPALDRRDPVFRPFTRRLSLEPSSTFLAEKGIRTETAGLFEAGTWPGPGFLQGCVGVRLHDLDGRALGYAGRRLDAEQARRLGKWKVPPRLPKGHLLYNAHRVRADLDGSTVALVECPWGVMRLHQLGQPAVALLGVHLSRHQRDALRGAACVLVLLDGDRAGREGAARIRASLDGQGPAVRVVELPEGQDPDDLADEELRALFLL